MASIIHAHNNHIELSAVTKKMIQAALLAGESLRKDFYARESLQIKQKTPGDFVSNADLNSEKILVKQLLTAYPDYGFLNEEAGEIEGRNKEYRWIIDPLDGTANFLQGIPHWSVSIALEKTSEGEKEIIASVIYDPSKSELFIAEKGCGAYLGDTPLSVGSQTDLQACSLATSLPTKSHAIESNSAIRYTKLASTMGRVRALGSATLDLCYIAAGRFDLCHLDRKIQYWDMAAGSLMVTEAGGTVTDLQGTHEYLEKGQILAGNSDIHKLALEVLTQSH